MERQNIREAATGRERVAFREMVDRIIDSIAREEHRECRYQGTFNCFRKPTPRGEMYARSG